jgi:hypothetical protein
VPRNTEGLRRGQTPEEARRSNAIRREKKARYAEERKEIQTSETLDPSSESYDPQKWYQQFHAEMTLHLAELVRKERTEKTKPSREVTDRLREYRQLTNDLTAYLRARGDDSEAERVIAAVETRLRQANLGDGLRPLLERPA